MMILVYGGSASGKSEFAESLLDGIEVSGKYYIATMKSEDDESVERIKKHRLKRRDKGFVTVEQPCDIEYALSENLLDKKDWDTSGAILECVTNLVANEMFVDGGVVSASLVSDKIYFGVKKLLDKIGTLVVVTGNVFAAGTDYDKYTLEYLSALGSVNRRLTRIADESYEVVCGIPVILNDKIEMP